MTMSHDPRTATADRSDLGSTYEPDHEDGTDCPEWSLCDHRDHDEPDPDPSAEDDALDAEVVSPQRTLERLRINAERCKRQLEAVELDTRRLL